jgi:hypothetical protein
MEIEKKKKTKKKRKTSLITLELSPLLKEPKL